MKHFKLLKSFLLALIAAMLPQLASADDFMVDGLCYYYNSDGTSVSVTSGGNYTGDIIIPENITYNGTTYSVTSIGDWAFSGCSGLTSVEIPYSVTSIGESAFEYCYGLTSVDIPNSVTSIGARAFSGCSGLTSVTIGNSVTSIGMDAFYECYGLKSVYITDLAAWCKIYFDYDYYSLPGYYCGFYCDSNPLSYAHNLYLNGNKVTNLIIPDSVTTITSAAFYGCSGLTSVTIPNSVTLIGGSAFYGCSGLTSIVVEAGNTKYDSRDNCNAIIETATNTLLYGCNNTIVPNSVTSIGSYAFYGCTGLTSINIPNSVTSIGSYAFYGCTGLTSINIPNSVTWVGERAFYECYGLKSVYITDLAAWCDIVFYDGDKYDYLENHEHYINYSNPLSYAHNLYLNGNKVTNLVIPNSITAIKNYAFINCTGLTSVTIPNSVTSIGESAFYECSGLTSMVVESGNTKYDSRNNCNAIIETATNTLVLGCKNTIIPNSVTSIGEYAFYDCTGLTSVTIPNSVTSIGNSAFAHCSGLTSVTIPNSVTEIGESAFEYCTDLISLTIPNSVTRIDSRAFIGCIGLTSIYSKIKNPEYEYVSYGRDIFNDDHICAKCIFKNDYDDNYALYYDCALYVPKGTSDIYSDIWPWCNFNNIIEMDPSGDVNDDGTVNVGDYVATASYILEKDPQPFYFEEGDLDCNNEINVGDLVGVTYIALHYGEEPMPAPAVGTKETPSLAMAADVMGNYEITINLSNDVDITALQMDLNLPAGMTLVDASLSDRASASHQVAFNQLSNGDYRLLASSSTCKSFNGNDGSVLTLTLAGEPNGNGIIKNIELATPHAASYKVDNIELNFTSPTGIEDMTAATTTRIYSEGGNIVIISPNDDTAQIVLPNGMNKTVKVAVGRNVYEAPAKGIVIVKMGNEVKKMRF